MAVKEQRPYGQIPKESGREATEAIDSPLTTKDMLQSCLKMLGNKQQAILGYLHMIYPSDAPRDVTAENSGASVTSSAFANNVSSLKSAGMITYTPNKTLRAADWLFID